MVPGSEPGGGPVTPPGLKRGMVTALTVYMTLLVVATGWVLFWGPG